MLHLKEEAMRCLLCEDAPCTKACKTGDPARAIRAIRFDNEKNAWRWTVDCSEADLERAEQACIHYDRPIRIREMAPSNLPRGMAPSNLPQLGEALKPPNNLPTTSPSWGRQEGASLSMESATVTSSRDTLRLAEESRALEAVIRGCSSWLEHCAILRTTTLRFCSGRFRSILFARRTTTKTPATSPLLQIVYARGRRTHHCRSDLWRPSRLLVYSSLTRRLTLNLMDWLRQTMTDMPSGFSLFLVTHRGSERLWPTSPTDLSLEDS